MEAEVVRGRFIQTCEEQDWQTSLSPDGQLIVSKELEGGNRVYLTLDGDEPLMSLRNFVDDFDEDKLFESTLGATMAPMTPDELGEGEDAQTVPPCTLIFRTVEETWAAAAGLLDALELASMDPELINPAMAAMCRKHGWTIVGAQDGHVLLLLRTIRYRFYLPVNQEHFAEDVRRQAENFDTDAKLWQTIQTLRAADPDEPLAVRDIMASVLMFRSEIYALAEDLETWEELPDA